MPLRIPAARYFLCAASLIFSDVWCGAQSIAVPWSGYGHDAQHTGISSVAAQQMNVIHWQTPVDEHPQYSGTTLYIHYGSPLSTRANTNDVQVSAPAGLTSQPNVFFANIPGILLPGENYTGPFFSVALSPGAASADYGATLTVSGGADIFAAGTLTTAGFTVLSPAVTISATTPDALEFGPVPGAFTISRTGGTGIPLNVNFAVGGTAANGSACAVIAPSVTLGTGVSATNAAVVPIPNNTADGDRTVLLTLAASTSYNLGASVAGTVTIRDKPADQWRLQNFGAAANTPPASDTANWSLDGVANVVKYGLGLDPVVINVSELPRATMVNGYLTLSFVPNPSATDILFSVEGCPDLATWSAGNVEPVTLSNPMPPDRLTYRYRQPTGSVGAAFIRLRIDRLP